MKLPIKHILKVNKNITAYIKGVFVDKDGKQEGYETLTYDGLDYTTAKKFYCEYCQRGFATYHGLRNHQGRWCKKK